MRRLFFLLAVGALAAGLLTATGSAAGGTNAGACASQLPAKMGRFSGIVHAQAISGPSCDPTSPLGGRPASALGRRARDGDRSGQSGHHHPDLLGAEWVISTRAITGTSSISTWRMSLPPAARHERLLDGDRVSRQQRERDGYNIVRGAPIRDHNPLPKGRGCSVGKLDTSGIYADGSGYTACLDDAQITAEIQNVITALGLPQNDYNHEYVMITPKHVESCFFSGSTTNKKNVCTINHYPSAGYCAYHTMFGPNYPISGTVYANMPYPIYHSPVGFTCGTDAGGHGTIESPNFNGSASSTDADVEVSPLSHEIMESITDPNTSQRLVRR